jgi:hypothetical protein
MKREVVKWHEEPFVLLAVQYNSGGDNLDNLRFAEGNGFDGEQLLHVLADPKSHIGCYNGKADRAKLDAYLAHSKRAGMKQIVYFNTHCITQEVRDSHPDWVQIDRDKNEIMAYGTYYLNCINGDWFDGFFKGNVAELARHGIEGIFLDGPVISDQGCFCAVCRERFLKHYGIPMEEGTAQQRLLFNVDAVTEYMRKTHAIVKGVNPDVLLYINNSALRADVTGSNTRKVSPYVDMLGAEGGFVWVNKHTPLWPVSPEAKILETQAKGKPTVIFIAGDYKPASYTMHTAEETNIYYAQTVANGANVWYGISGGIEHMDTPGGRAAVAFNHFLKKNKPYYTKTRPVASVALMWSQDTANFYSSTVSASDFTAGGKIGTGKKGDHTASFMGFYEILQRGHIQHGVIDEEALTDGTLQHYDTLILPTVACLSEKNAAAITAFVRNGGTLISAFDSGFYTETGAPLSVPSLMEVQGIKSFDGLTLAHQGCGFQRITADWLKEGIGWQLTITPNYILDVTPADTATVLSERMDIMKGRYTPLPERAHPHIIMNAFGKGRSIYFPGNTGEFFNASTNPDWKRMILNCINRFSAPVITTDAPGSVEVVVRRQEGRYVVHFINMTGEMERPIQRIVPLHNVTAKLRTDCTITKAFSLTGEIRFNGCKDNICEFELPALYVFDVIVLES